MKIQNLIFIGMVLLLGGTRAGAEVDSESHDVIVRGPASVAPPVLADPVKDRDQLLEITGKVVQVLDFKTLLASSDSAVWSPGETVGIESKQKDVGVVAFVEVKSVEKNPTGGVMLKLELLRQSRTNFVELGDQIFKLDLSSHNSRYKGTTDLFIKKRSKGISARYRPLFTQGLNIGETAQSLWQDEILVTYYGLFDYGVTDRITLGTALPLDVTGSPNLQGKYKFWDSASTVLSSGFSFAKIPNETSSTLNLNLFWDGVSSESQITHTYLTIALFSFDQAKDATAIQSLGTTSFQSGYEFVMDNWDRVLLGPNYNFEKKTLGGYLSYVFIWDQFHLALSANSTNIRSVRLSAQDGYYLFFDAYWRF